MTIPPTSTPEKTRAWIYDLLMIGVLLIGAYFRFVGDNWGDFSNQHPDELFFSEVTSALQPVGTGADVLGPPPTLTNNPWRATFPKDFPDCKAWGGYFDTSCSPLNPNNRGYGFYVYGDLPVILVRYLDVWLQGLGSLPLLGQNLSTLANNVTLLGRQLSGLMDLGTVALLYFIVKRFYKPHVALLSALFSALAVEQIQQAHFYTSDSFLIFFMTLTVFFASLIATWGKDQPEEEAAAAAPVPVWTAVKNYLVRLGRDRMTYLCLAFGLALGMAAACKVNAAVLGATLPLALVVRYLRVKRPAADTASAAEQAARPRSAFEDLLAKAFVFLVIGALLAILSFRVFQPYAFEGLKFNPQWTANIKDYLNQASPDADMPWSLQWARRTHLYSFQNLTIWGLGLPLGILAWAGFLWMGWRILRGEWRQHLLLWAWTGGYFLWQSLQWNPTMRYQLPIYPLLAMMAAWFVFTLIGAKFKLFGRTFRGVVLGSALGAAGLLLTAAWAFAFTRIYVRPEVRVAASNWIFQNIPGPIDLYIQTADGNVYHQPLPFQDGRTITAEAPYTLGFTAQAGGSLTQVALAYVADSGTPGTPQTLSLTVAGGQDAANPQNPAGGSVTADFGPQRDPRGNPATVTLSQPLQVVKGQAYSLTLSTSGGTLALTGAAVLNETDFDYNLPFRTAGYDPFGGIYRGGLNLQVYYPDDGNKLNSFETLLNQGDYILIPTAHQYSQITRIPERYPLTTVYYRDLLGCPPDKDIIWCYRVAVPGMFHGSLGFDLVAVFTSYPSLGPLEINDQSAEEAFTFYDHPKVMIFQKTADYDPARVQSLLGAVDLSTAIQLNPRQATAYKSLMLPADKLAVQQAGGTWSQLFNWDAIQNKYPVVGLVLWYVFIFVLGLLTYPIVRAALPGLSDRGYPLARIAGLLIWAWFAWLAGSLGLSYTRPWIAVALGLLALIGILLGVRQRGELLEEWRSKKKYFLLAEGLFLAFFLLDLGIRLGNPDLWHPAKGGERPMDFAYLNAILKSTTFPPYDPWYAGGYINYYYYGYVIVGTPVKLLGIVPSIAFNFILPTLFASLAMGAFSVGWNLLDRLPKLEETEPDADEPLGWRKLFRKPAFYTGLAASSAMVLLGNLGILRMFYQGFQRLAAPNGVIDNANLFQRLNWAAAGFLQILGGASLPYGPGDWYWFPSRALPDASGGPITEFPLFTFIYSDLHAHMMALPLTVLAIAWVLSVVLSRAKWKGFLDALVSFFLGGLVIGALKPTNTWDIYTYLLLAGIVLAYTVWRNADLERLPLALPPAAKRLLYSLGSVAVLAGLSLLFYQPFTQSFYQAYNSFQLWPGGRSDVISYLTHWGVFLFIVVSWMVWETREWMAATPVSSLRKLRPYLELIIGAIVVMILILVVQQVWVMSPTQNVPFPGLTILWLALPLAAWAGVLILRPGQPDVKRLVLFMVGTALVLTMVVEIFVVSGDVGRMNTVFKFYMQAWVMLGLSAAAAFGWLLLDLRRWLPGWRVTWQAAATVLVASAALFLLLGGSGKIHDRMAANAPHTLDTMTYMDYSTYAEYGRDLNLSEDYHAIIWMQKNVQGSPVIVEAPSSGVQYTWLNRFSIYTGLPDVVGWQWHQQQQRVLQSDQVVERGAEVDDFYATTDINAARAFLSKYNIRYIIVGQLERAKYAPGAPGGFVQAGGPDGLAKFDQYNGALWKEVYRSGDTVIYQVLP